MQEQQFSQQFFFPFNFFFSFPLPALFQIMGLRGLYKIANSQGHCSWLTREEWIVRSAFPMNEEDVISSRLAHQALSVIPTSPFLLSHPGGFGFLH